MGDQPVAGFLLTYGEKTHMPGNVGNSVKMYGMIPLITYKL